jgi:hypothetical protein
LTHIEERSTRPRLEAGAGEGHMSVMRKYHDRLAVFAGVRAPAGPATLTIEKTGVGGAVTACSHLPTSVNTANSFWTGMTSLDMFPSTFGTVRMFTSDGLRTDWTCVGRDMRRAMGMIEQPKVRAINERESAS